EHDVEKGRGMAPPARVRRGRHPEAEVGLLEAATRAHEDVRMGTWGALRPTPRRTRRARPAAKQALDGSEHLGRTHSARGGDDEVLRPVPGAVMVVEVFAADRAHGLRGAEDRRAEWMTLPEHADEILVREVLRVVVGLADLLEDHASLDLDV